ncbi:hypothetical protein COCNU_06G019710 [Cocos nucifera]|uniref:Uncharacterized protein n=1 Tax=Cocos nucifera TaxID=13894 RepID=A0A8K0N4J0_COCNU|nr:hypothetical protein COCNU_06G019710 [Cocos nucifera]
MGKTTRLFHRCVRSAIKALCCVRDSYVRSPTVLSGSAQFAAAAGYGSFTASFGFPLDITSSRDTREISRRCAEAPQNRRAEGRAAPFSRGVVLETIDEDKPCEFGADVRVCSDLLLGRRASCHAWGKGTVRWYAGGLG